MMTISPYHLCHQFLSIFFQSAEIPKGDSSANSSSTPEYNKHNPYRVSKTPYKDALMQGVVTYKFVNRTPRYYQKLGHKINQIVDKRQKKRPFGNWWVDEYLRMSYIDKNRFLKRHGYCIITNPSPSKIKT